MTTTVVETQRRIPHSVAIRDALSKTAGHVMRGAFRHAGAELKEAADLIGTDGDAGRTLANAADHLKRGAFTHAGQALESFARLVENEHLLKAAGHVMRGAFTHAGQEFKNAARRQDK